MDNSSEKKDDLISLEDWNALRSLIGDVTKGKKIVKALIDNEVDVDPVILLLAQAKPPRWMKDFLIRAPRDIFGDSPAFLLVWLIYLEWRYDMAKGDKKYKLYPANRGVRQELNRLLKMAGGKKGVIPTKDIVQKAAGYTATSIVHLWAGLPREDWLLTTKPVELVSNNGLGQSIQQKWSELVKYITDKGTAPAWARLNESDVMDLAIALSSGDKPTIDKYHTRVTGALDG